MAHMKFDLAKIARLDDPARFDDLNPEAMWEALGRPAPTVVVDIGAGTGLFARRFAQMLPAATVYAVDTEPEMIEWIEEHRDTAIGDRIRTVLADETSVPLPDGVAQLVAMINLHHELAAPEASYAEALRLLGPGGRLLVVDWSRNDAPGGPPREIRATFEGLAGMLREVGFEDVTGHAGLPRHTLVTARKGE